MQKNNIQSILCQFRNVLGENYRNIIKTAEKMSNQVKYRAALIIIITESLKSNECFIWKKRKVTPDVQTNLVGKYAMDLEDDDMVYEEVNSILGEDVLDHVMIIN